MTTRVTLASRGNSASMEFQGQEALSLQDAIRCSTCESIRWHHQTTLTPNFSSCHPISKLKNAHSMKEGFESMQMHFFNIPAIDHSWGSDPVPRHETWHWKFYAQDLYTRKQIKTKHVWFTCFLHPPSIIPHCLSFVQFLLQSKPKECFYMMSSK